MMPNPFNLDSKSKKFSPAALKPSRPGGTSFSHKKELNMVVHVHFHWIIYINVQTISHFPCVCILVKKNVFSEISKFLPWRAATAASRPQAWLHWRKLLLSEPCKWRWEKKIKGQVFKQKNAPCVAKWDIFRDTFFIKHHYGNLKTNVLETFWV